MANILTNAILLLLMIIAGLISKAPLAYGYEGQRANSVLLNGVWEYALGQGNEGAEMPEGQSHLDWKEVDLPGQFMEWSQEAATNIKFVWARRTFQVSKSQAEILAVLRWNYITLGAMAFINGQKIGENEPTGPYQVLIPKGVLKPGENQIVLKIAGAAGVSKAKSGYFLIPAGFASCHRRGMPSVTDDVWIDFADRVYMKWVLAMPDLDDSKVKIRVTLTGADPIDDLKIAAEVRPWPNGEIIGSGEASARLMPDPDPLGGEHFFVEVPMPGFKAWTYEDCNLYAANVSLMKDGKILDNLNFRFGMREIQVVDSNYKLNGRSLWLRGSNLVFEWDWGDVITGKEKEYLVTEAREMSMNSFRTHTRPLPRLWADICDEYGTMILAEFPVLYNYSDYKFTPEEYETWHRNVLIDATGWMARLWNHPSVVMWVLSNESSRDNEWEEGPYQDFVNQLDPTRPTMRTGTTGTKENCDVHTCGNTIRPDEGHLLLNISRWFRKTEGRTVTNTEYMNIFSRPLEQWTGKKDEDADRLAYAQIGMEHTEAMRRARLDGLWPYMYAGWTKTRRGGEIWKAGFAQPVSACWHSSLSPVLASLDLFNPNYLTSQEVTTALYLINDSWHDAKIQVDLLLTKESPEFIPEVECFEDPVEKWTFTFDLKADTIAEKPITWKLPAEEGNYWLTARTTGIPGRPVLSQRFVRAINPPEVPDPARKRTFVILGDGPGATVYFKSKGLKVSNRVEALKPDEDVVIIWNASKLTAEERQSAKLLCDFAADGGHVIALSTGTWDWQQLCEVNIEEPTPFSRVFVYEGVSHSMLSGIDPEWLMRWNGLPGTVAVAEVLGSPPDETEKILWAREPGSTVVAEVPAAAGKGKILFSQLDLRNHIDNTDSNYDPAAERIFLNLLGW